MPNNELGKVRRSMVLMNYGPGAIIDFRAGRRGAPVSIVAAGLEEWDSRASAKGLAHPQTIYEPRLQKKLSVDGFRLPPVVPDDERDDHNDVLVGARFPVWLQCPSCNTLNEARQWASDPGDPARYCANCSAGRAADQRVHAVPVRFVTACQHGHLDDFPWHYWVQHRDGCGHRGELRLESKGAGLGGLVLSCPACGQSRSMERIFKADALAALRCRGRRPWLAGADEACELKPVVLQRGASNLYFPQVVSALDIPPWSDHVQKVLGQYWQPILNIENTGQRADFLRTIWTLLAIEDMTLDELIATVEHRIRAINEPERQNLRWDEYQQFCASTGAYDREFEIRESEVPEILGELVSRLVRAVRLREVRSITSFTRIEPPGGRIAVNDGRPEIRPAMLSMNRKNWLPAIEVRGEGIFVELSPDQIRSWEQRDAVMNRVRKLVPTLRASNALALPESDEIDESLAARFMMIHTLAHILMKQLSLECGYSSASLRERLFVGKAPHDMCAVLIYTASSDSDGTLGGLQRQGESARFTDLFVQAIRGSEWCSSDPLCIEGVSAATEATSLAACHSCVLAPETSCEEYNRFLDRGLVVGTPDEPDLGYFRSLLQSR